MTFVSSSANSFTDRRAKKRSNVTLDGKSNGFRSGNEPSFCKLWPNRRRRRRKTGEKEKEKKLLLACLYVCVCACDLAKERSGRRKRGRHTCYYICFRELATAIKCLSRKKAAFRASNRRLREHSHGRVRKRGALLSIFFFRTASHLRNLRYTAKQAASNAATSPAAASASAAFLLHALSVHIPASKSVLFACMDGPRIKNCFLVRKRIYFLSY